MTRFVLSCVLLAGCAASDPQGLTEEERAAMVPANDTLAAASFSAQSASFGTESGLRAACPAVDRQVDGAEVVVTVDYGDGCTPGSGIIPAEMSGALTVAVGRGQVSVAFDQLAADGSSIDGSLAGTWDDAGAGGVLAGLDSALEFGSGVDVDQALDALLGRSDVTFDGAAEVWTAEESTSTTTSGVVLAYADVWGECPLPHAGVMTVEQGPVSIEIHFLEDTPETGEVEVVSGRTTMTVPLCEALTRVY